MSREELQAASVKQTSYKLVASRLRGTVFDTNMHKLTNQDERIVAAVMPTKQGMADVLPYLINETEEMILKKQLKLIPVTVWDLSHLR